MGYKAKRRTFELVIFILLTVIAVSIISFGIVLYMEHKMVEIFYIFALFAFMVFLKGLIPLLSAQKWEKNKVRLTAYGERVLANFTDVSFSTRASRSGRMITRYNIICEWTDETTGITYIFKSENLWENPRLILERKNIKQLPVYLNKNNYKKYYVAVDEVLS